MSLLHRSIGRLLFLVCLAGSRAEILVGNDFPALNEAQLVGGDLPATAGKVVLIDFWASWCAPCRASFAALARLHEEFGARGLVIVAVSVDKKPAAYAKFVKDRRPPFAALLDQEQKLVNVVQVPAMPTSYVVDRHGSVRFLHQGFHGRETELEMRREIATLLAAQD